MKPFPLLAQIVDDDEIARLERRQEYLLDLVEEAPLIGHRSRNAHQYDLNVVDQIQVRTVSASATRSSCAHVATR